jgi:predicted ATPase
VGVAGASPQSRARALRRRTVARREGGNYELAAARTSLFSPEQLLERIGERLELLRGSRDVDPRQQTLRTTIDWSYELLNAEERRVFRAFSVFAGGATLAAAEDICNTDADTVQSLLDKSLVRRRDTKMGPRYWMLESLREYALEQLVRDGEATDVENRHEQWFTSLAEQADAEQRTLLRDSWIARLSFEENNFRPRLTVHYAMTTLQISRVLQPRSD